MFWIDDCNTIDEVLNFLVEKTPQRTTDESSADALLVFEFFPTLGPQFCHSAEVKADQVEQFKQDFDYSKICVDRNEALSRIQDIDCITKIVDVLVELMPQETKKALMKAYLLEVWFKQNSNSDLNHFKQNLKRDYWLS